MRGIRRRIWHGNRKALPGPVLERVSFHRLNQPNFCLHRRVHVALQERIYLERIVTTDKIISRNLLGKGRHVLAQEHAIEYIIVQWKGFFNPPQKVKLQNIDKRKKLMLDLIIVQIRFHIWNILFIKIKGKEGFRHTWFHHERDAEGMPRLHDLENTKVEGEDSSLQPPSSLFNP